MTGETVSLFLLVFFLIYGGTHVYLFIKAQGSLHRNRL